MRSQNQTDPADGYTLVKLDNGSEIEVALDKENDAFSIFPADAKTVKSIKMISKIEDTETTYDFAAATEVARRGVPAFEPSRRLAPACA